MLDLFSNHWRLVLSAVALCVDVAASLHALLNKRDSRSVITWIGLIWLVPVAGSLLYFCLGINRLQRRAQRLRTGHSDRESASHKEHESADDLALSSVLTGQMPNLSRLVRTVTARPLVGGNSVEPLRNGDQAYPQMLAAIEAAKRSIGLSTYIFDNDRAGARFLAALKGAVARGVDVRVIVDDVGSRYSVPSMIGQLRRAHVPVTRFLPTFMPWRSPFPNLRNHRKLLIVDGETAFTGGLNIREGHCLADRPRHPVADLHFLIRGPVVRQMQEIFADDWHFCTDETLKGGAWFPEPQSTGGVFARGISHGPDDDFEILKTIFLGAISCASERIVVITPYFLPDAALVCALNVAALRGVQVDIVLPQHGNLPLVEWASTAQLWQVLEHGCRVWWTPPPFDHTKLMLVDGAWSLIGSANWDARSLRLNFEFNLECYDSVLCANLVELANEKIRNARRVSLEDVDGRPFPRKLRDGLAKLLTPYL